MSETKRRGPRPKPANSLRSEVQKVSFTPPEWVRLVRAAAEAELTVPDYCRHAILDRVDTA